ncbi:MAG: glycerol-3-phosphate 1-O-acyltransferase [Phycisphaerales bacterium]|nr:glycerol-3-phosphate 1-O-acyltransferase [Phycisphaerales bacterium]
MVWIAGAFVAGSIPFGMIIGRAHGIDICALGSKNIGATNVGRVLGRRWGMVCFALDAFKGAAPVAALILLASPTAANARESTLIPLVGAAAILGHIYSPWVGFKGGKGVATSFGALLAMWPTMTFAALGALVVWLIVVKASRFISLASMVAAASLPILYAAFALWPIDEGAWSRLLSSGPLLVATLALAVLVLWKHRANIARLRAGTEPRVRDSTKPPCATVQS